MAALKTLFNEFDLLLDAPNSVKKMRELILRFAVQGKLVFQDPNDEPASELLKKIKAEKEKLIKEGKIKPQKPLPPINPEEIPYELPKGWEWEIIISLYYNVSTSKKQIKTNDYLEFGKYPIIDQGQKLIGGYTDDDSKVIHLENPLIIFGDHTREIKFIDFDFAPGADGTKIIRPFRAIYPRYFYLVLNNYDLEKLGYARHYKILKTQYFPIPPLEEQKRIVNKADELMKLCDKLEGKQKKAFEDKALLNDTALNNLFSAEDSSELRKHWTFISSNFDLLYDVPENIKKLRQSILQLAVQGKLVPQDLNDEPAFKLVQKIKAEKEKLIEEGKIKSQKFLPPIDQGEIPYELPKSWEWVRLGDICKLITDGCHHTPDYISKGIPFLSVKNISKGFIDFSDVKFISEEQHKQLKKRCRPEFNDVLLTKVGTTGIAKVIDAKEEFSIFVSVALLKFNFELIFPYFLEYQINSPLVKKQSEKYTMGVGNKNLVLKYIKSFVIVLPPANEQKRIVKKVDELMKLCDELEANLKKSKEDSELLMQSVLQEAFNK